MHSVAIEHLEKGKLALVGALTFETVAALLPQTKQVLPSSCELEINLEKVSQCDSAGLAFLTALYRYIKSHNGQLVLAKVPAQVLAIAKVSGLDSILTMR